MIPYKFRTMLNKTIAAAAASEQQIEAARYAVLRRLSPSLRHHLVRHLQPIGMIYGVMDHRLSAQEPDLHTIHNDAKKINHFAKAALAQCVDISTWLAPEPTTFTPVGECVKECIDLIAANLNFRGYQIINEVGEPAVEVRRDALRMVLIAAMLAVTDALAEPAQVTLNATTNSDHLTLSMLIDLNYEGHAEAYYDGYRKLCWGDVNALAASEDVSVVWNDDQVSMSFPMQALRSSP